LCIMVGFAIAYRLLCYAVLQFKLLRRRRWRLADWLTDDDKGITEPVNGHSQHMYCQPIANTQPTDISTHRLFCHSSFWGAREDQGDDDPNRETDRHYWLTPPTHTLHKSLVKKLSGLPKTILKKAALEHQ
jgi:hypothetical protein